MKNKAAVFMATWFYCGLIPPMFGKGMGGTYGSFFSLPLCYLALELAKAGTVISYLLVMAVVFLLGLWCVPKAEIGLGKMIDQKGKQRVHDQNQIVIDEVFGMLTSCLPLLFIQVKLTWLALGLAFAFFRFFDITKIPPTRFFDRMQSAKGVMLDDFVAGIYAALSLLVVSSVFGI